MKINEILVPCQDVSKEKYILKYLDLKIAQLQKQTFWSHITLETVLGAYIISGPLDLSSIHISLMECLSLKKACKG